MSTVEQVLDPDTPVPYARTMVAAPILPKPQTWKLADALNAWNTSTHRPMYSTMGVCMARRTAKTTGILAVAMGRCLCRPGYVVIFSAQSGTKASARFLDLARMLDRVNPNDAERGFRILRGAGNQLIEFSNGSLFLVVPPKGDAFRGDAADLIILDESQEHDVATSEELLGAILPTMDTRPGAQIVIAGTTGVHRSGLFWDTLEEGRNGVPGTGILEFGMPDGTQPPETEEEALAMISQAHPGVGNLTSLEVMAERFGKLPLPQFMREYLGVWPEDYTQSAIDAAAWKACALTEDVSKWPRPAKFALGFDVAPDGSSAALVAAWRDGENAYVEIIEHRQGADWLVPRTAEIARKYRVLVGHDTIGHALAESESLARQRPKPRTRATTMRDIGAGCATFEKEIRNKTLRHFDQKSLNDAAAKVAKRPLGESAWAWGRKASGVDITTLVAATIALRVYDVGQTSASVGVIVAKGNAA